MQLDVFMEVGEALQERLGSGWAAYTPLGSWRAALDFEMLGPWDILI